MLLFRVFYYRQAGTQEGIGDSQNIYLPWEYMPPILLEEMARILKLIKHDMGWKGEKPPCLVFLPLQRGSLQTSILQAFGSRCFLSLLTCGLDFLSFWIRDWAEPGSRADMHATMEPHAFFKHRWDYKTQLEDRRNILIHLNLQFYLTVLLKLPQHAEEQRKFCMSFTWTSLFGAWGKFLSAQN